MKFRRMNNACVSMMTAFLVIGALHASMADPSAGARTQTGRITVIHSDRGTRTAGFVIHEAEVALKDLEKEFGSVAEMPVTIILLENEEDMRRAVPSGLPEWFAGAALTRENTIYLKTSSVIPGGPADLSRTLAHEMTHLYLKWKAGGNFLPRWLEEGMAVRQAGSYGWSHRLSLSTAAVRGNIEPLGFLEYAFPEEEAAARRAYAASFKFVGYLLGYGGHDAFMTMLDLVAGGRDFHEAFPKAYGRSVAEMERAWRQSLRRYSRWITFAAGGSTLWMLMSVLFLLVYWHKRVSSRRKLEELDEESWTGMIH